MEMEYVVLILKHIIHIWLKMEYQVEYEYFKLHDDELFPQDEVWEHPLLVKEGITVLFDFREKHVITFSSWADQVFLTRAVREIPRVQCTDRYRQKLASPGCLDPSTKDFFLLEDLPFPGRNVFELSETSRSLKEIFL